MQPFSYRPEGREPITMSYWEVPPRLLEEPHELTSWAREAHRIARAAIMTKEVTAKDGRR